MFRLKNGFKQVFKDKIVIIFLMLIMLYTVYSYIANPVFSLLPKNIELYK